MRGVRPAFHGVSLVGSLSMPGASSAPPQRQRDSSGHENSAGRSIPAKMSPHHRGRLTPPARASVQSLKEPGGRTRRARAGQPSADLSPAGSASVASSHGQHRPEGVGLGAGGRAPQRHHGGQLPEGFPEGQGVKLAFHDHEGSAGSDRRGPWVADEAGRVAKRFGVLRLSAVGLANFDKRQPIPDEPRNHHPEGSKRSVPVSGWDRHPGRPPEAGGADRLGRQAPRRAGQVGQGVRPLGCPQPGGGGFHEGHGVPLSLKPEGFGDGLGAGLVGGRMGVLLVGVGPPVRKATASGNDRFRNRMTSAAASPFCPHP